MASKPIKYRGYEISANATAFCRFVYAHEDYDGPEDSRCGFEATAQDCKDAIDERIDEGFDR